MADETPPTEAQPEAAPEVSADAVPSSGSAERILNQE
jgi:hypothetical protein